MNDRWRIRLGLLALVLAASCGQRALTKDAGADGSGAAGATGGGARGGTGGAGNVGGPGTGGVNPAGTGGAAGRGGGGGIAGTFVSGRGGVSGTAGVTGRGGAAGGFAGTGGVAGTFVTGRGGIAGTSDLAGRGGVIGTGGVSGRGGVAGTSDVAGRGGVIGTGGVAGTSDVAGRGGVIGMGGAGRGGSGGVGGTGGTAGRGGSGGTAGTGVCLTCQMLILPLEAVDLVYNAARNELYASVTGEHDTYPNTIVVVDPATASVTAAIPIGSDPGALALSDDGSTLWVAIYGAHAFRKVTMSATPPLVGPLIHLPKARPDGYFDVQSMAVLAGAPLSVVVAMSDGYGTSEVRAFDDGVPRATAVTNAQNDLFVISGPPGVAFGADASSFNFHVFSVSASGITQSSYQPFQRSPFGRLAYAGDRVLSGGGDLIDVSKLPVWARGISNQGPVARRDPMSLMMLTTASGFPGPDTADVRILSSVMLDDLGRVPIPASIGPGIAQYRNLVYAGGDAAAFLMWSSGVTAPPYALVILHHPALGTPIGGGGGASGTGGAGAAGAGGTGGTGGVGGGVGGTGAPDPCPGCTSTTVQAYGHDMVFDATRKLIYVASDGAEPLHPSTIVTVDAASAQVASFVPVGNDPLALALSDDGSALWVGLVGERRVRRMTPGTSPVPGPAYSLPMLLTTGEAAVPASITVLPGTPSSIAVGVFGSMYYTRGVFILDDGQLRANFVQPPEVPVNFLANGPPGYLLGISDDNKLITIRLGAVGATLESYGGLLANYYTATGFLYSAGAVYASTGAVIDLTNPDAPLPAGRFPLGAPGCRMESRSATRVMMLCPDYGSGPQLFMLDSANFTRVGTLTLPSGSLGDVWKFLYLGGDAVALLGNQTPMQILHAPMIGSPP